VTTAVNHSTFRLSLFADTSAPPALALVREAHHAIIIMIAPSDAPTGCGMMEQIVGNHRIAADFDKFRLRRFVERLVDMDEVEIHDEPVALAEMSGFIEATSKALLFRRIVPERHEVVVAVSDLDFGCTLVCTH
jgi:hypothetical protein